MMFDTGATSQSIDIRIVDDSGLPVTGLVSSTFPTLKASVAGPNADTTITTSDLSLITTAYSSGGVKERGEGVYRLDLPDTLLASAGVIKIRGEASGKRVIADTIQVGAPVNAVRLNGTAQTARDIGASVVTANASDVTAIKAKTDNLPASPASTTNITAGTITSVTNAVTTSNASDVTAIKAKTDQLTFTVTNKVDATADVDASSIATDVLTTQMTEDYAAEGVAPTLAQAIMLLLQREFNVSISGSTMTVKKLDGSTTAATLTLNSATEPTSIARAT